MNIEKLSLVNFRNYDKLELKFSDKTNYIYGSNAQGKTNILEALYLFSQGRSHRAKTDRELIRFGKDFAKLSISFRDSERGHTAQMLLRKDSRKSVTINNVKIEKLSRLMNYLNLIMFSPEDLSLIKGSPSARRRFMDSAISQLYPGYLVSLSEYHKALKEKSNLLKVMKRSSDMMLLTVWNEQLAENGAKIMEYRSSFAELLNKFAADIQKEVSGEKLKLIYQPSIKAKPGDGDEFFKELEKTAAREIDFSSALIGIQRDDMAIMVNEKNARIYGSQGQQKTAALAVKMAQAEHINHIKGEYPALLLDDIMSELDIKRRSYLSEKIRGKQVFITSTDTELAKSTDATRLFRVDAGKVTEM